MPDCSRLAWHALCVLDEAVALAGKGKVAATPAIRLALGCLAAIDGDETPYRELWGILRDPYAAANSEDSGNYQRRTNAGIALIKVGRRHGIERIAPGVCEAMQRAWAKA